MFVRRRGRPFGRRSKRVAIRIVRLGTPRVQDEGVRIGTVRRPPRGVKKQDLARADFYDVWLPNLAPSAALVKAAQAAVTQAQWDRFRRRYRIEMSRPDARRVLDLLAVLSHVTNLSVGCYCEGEGHCHRAVLRDLLAARQADLGKPG